MLNKQYIHTCCDLLLVAVGTEGVEKETVEVLEGSSITLVRGLGVRKDWEEGFDQPALGLFLEIRGEPLYDVERGLSIEDFLIS